MVKGDNHVVASRIYRILISTEWNIFFNTMKHSTLQRLTSDHVLGALICGQWKHTILFQIRQLTIELLKVLIIELELGPLLLFVETKLLACSDCLFDLRLMD